MLNRQERTYYLAEGKTKLTGSKPELVSRKPKFFGRKTKLSRQFEVK